MRSCYLIDYPSELATLLTSKDNNIDSVLILTTGKPLAQSARLYLDKAHFVAAGKKFLAVVKTYDQLAFELAIIGLANQPRIQINRATVFLRASEITKTDHNSLAPDQQLQLAADITKIYEQLRLNSLGVATQHPSTETICSIEEIVKKLHSATESEYFDKRDCYSYIEENPNCLKDYLNKFSAIVLLGKTVSNLSNYKLAKLILKQYEQTATTGITKVTTYHKSSSNITVIQAPSERAEMEISLALAEAISKQNPNFSIGISYLVSEPYNSIAANNKDYMLTNISFDVNQHQTQSSSFRFLIKGLSLEPHSLAELSSLLRTAPISIKKAAEFIDSEQQFSTWRKYMSAELSSGDSNLSVYNLAEFALAISNSIPADKINDALRQTYDFHQINNQGSEVLTSCCVIHNGTRYCLGNICLALLKYLQEYVSTKSQTLKKWVDASKALMKLLAEPEPNSLESEHLQTISTALDILGEYTFEPDKTFTQQEFINLVTICLNPTNLKIDSNTHVKFAPLGNLLGQNLDLLIILGCSDQVISKSPTVTAFTQKVQPDNNTLRLDQFETTKTDFYTSLESFKTIVLLYPRTSSLYSTLGRELPWIKEYEKQYNREFNRFSLGFKYSLENNSHLNCAENTHSLILSTTNHNLGLTSPILAQQNLSTSNEKNISIQSCWVKDLVNYITCPKKYFYQTHLQLKPSTKNESVGTYKAIGSFIHSVLADQKTDDFYKLVDSLKNTDNVKKLFESISQIINNSEDELQAVPNDLNHRNMLTFGLINAAAIIYFWENIEANKQKRTIYCEKVFSVSLSQTRIFNHDNLNFKIEGRLDRIEEFDSDINIIDYKTHPSANRSNKVNKLTNKFQALIHELLVKEWTDNQNKNINSYIFNIDCSKINFDLIAALFKEHKDRNFLTQNKLVEEYKFNPSHYDLLNQTIELMRQGIFYETPSLFQELDDYNCKHCEFKTVCSNDRVLGWAKRNDEASKKIIKIRREIQDQ